MESTEYRYDVRTVDEDRMARQITECLPLIELERSAYIRAEFGRLQATMGTEYVDPDTGESRLFHEVDGIDNDLALEGEKPGDPYELTLDELIEMPSLTKRIERIGTYSYMPFFHMMPEDLTRLKLLSRMWSKIMHHYPCLESEVQQLKEGHGDFLKSKLEDRVKVIR